MFQQKRKIVSYVTRIVENIAATMISEKVIKVFFWIPDTVGRVGVFLKQYK